MNAGRMRRAGPAAGLALCLVIAGGLAQPIDVRAQTKADQAFPDIIAAKITPRGGMRFDFDVTVSSPYDTAARYADAFRVKAPDGRVLGERILLHDHADEQPFTRELTGVAIAVEINEVTIEGRDLKNGWGGKTLLVRIPGR
jgi:hypothetical protein